MHIIAHTVISCRQYLPRACMHTATLPSLLLARPPAAFYIQHWAKGGLNLPSFHSPPTKITCFLIRLYASIAQSQSVGKFGLFLESWVTPKRGLIGKHNLQSSDTFRVRKVPLLLLSCKEVDWQLHLHHHNEVHWVLGCPRLRKPLTMRKEKRRARLDAKHQENEKEK